MSAPLQGASLEEHLGRMKSLMTVVEHILDHDPGAELADEYLAQGAEICLAEALDVLDRIQVGLSAKVLNTKIADGGAR